MTNGHLSVVVPFPPATNTLPDDKSVCVNFERAHIIDLVSENVCVLASYISAGDNA